MSGAVSSAFAIVRPPGHHAECARAMGAAPSLFSTMVLYDRPARLCQLLAPPPRHANLVLSAPGVGDAGFCFYNNVAVAALAARLAGARPLVLDW